MTNADHRFIEALMNWLIQADDSARASVLLTIRETICVYCGRLFMVNGERCDCLPSQAAP
jgi:hypothetical protein